MTPGQFAEMLGWSARSADKTVANLESGREEPSIKVVRSVLSRMNLSFDQCFALPEDRAATNASLDIASQILSRRDGSARELEMFILGMSKGLGVRAQVAPPILQEGQGSMKERRSSTRSRKKAG